MNLVSQILNENPEGLAALAKRLPSSRRNGSLTPQALWRWATRGIRLPDGRVVRLETCRVAGRFLSSAAAVERFVTAQNQPLDPTPLPSPARSATKRQRADASAAELLERVGI